MTKGLSNKRESAPVLRRYTGLPVLFDILVKKQLTVSGYQNWKDENDRFCLDLYKSTLNYGFLGAVCLTQAHETFHHWQVYAGESGVCIVFDKARFIDRFRNEPNTIVDPVNYVNLNGVREFDAGDLHQLPFLKRSGFQDERELRLIGFAAEEGITSMPFELSLDTVKYLTLSPFLHPALVESTKVAIRSIAGCEKLDVRHSKLTNSKVWQRNLSDFRKRHGMVYGPWIDLDRTSLE